MITTCAFRPYLGLVITLLSVETIMAISIAPLLSAAESDYWPAQRTSSRAWYERNPQPIMQPQSVAVDRDNSYWPVDTEGATYRPNRISEVRPASPNYYYESDLENTFDTYLVTDQEEIEDAEESDNESNDMKPRQDRSSGKKRSRFDESVVSRGQQFFQSSCTQCHDANRALSKQKSLAAWRVTVRRMAAKEDADIPPSQHTAIATYLASLNPTSPSASDNDEDGQQEKSDTVSEALEDTPPFTLNGTVSAVWRGTDPDVENKGFFPDAWVGVEWRPNDSPISGRVTACTSCHGVNQGLGVELVEASATLDLMHVLTRRPPAKRCPNSLEAKIKGGRFIVPFGAYSGRVHPGELRTVSPPMMFNMGRRVGPIFPFQPVLNMPYADEGANLHLRKQLGTCYDLSATFDVYAVNGLQGGGPDVFFASRSYRDNNSNLAVGGRATFGNQKLKIGGSVASGEMQFDGLTLQNYKLAGGDVSFRWGEKLRAYYEYAIRDENPFPGFENTIYGNLVELEVMLWDDPQISVVTRYDTLDHRGDLGDQTIERFTWGLNFGLYGGSLLIVNHEHWNFKDRSDIDIMGIRWTVAF